MANQQYPFSNLFKKHDKEARELWKRIVKQQRSGKVSLAYIVARVLARRENEATALKTLRAYDDEEAAWQFRRLD